MRTAALILCLFLGACQTDDLGARMSKASKALRDTPPQPTVIIIRE